jgi:hypothetical protein
MVDEKNTANGQGKLPNCNSSAEGDDFGLGPLSDEIEIEPTTSRSNNGSGPGGASSRIDGSIDRSRRGNIRGNTRSSIGSRPPWRD